MWSSFVSNKYRVVSIEIAPLTHWQAPKALPTGQDHRRYTRPVSSNLAPAGQQLMNRCSTTHAQWRSHKMASKSSKKEEMSKEKIIATFQQLRMEQRSIANKVGELEAEKNEHM